MYETEDIGESIPIQTIQASDQSVPRLNLAQILKSRVAKNKMPDVESVTSDFSLNSKTEGVCQYPSQSVFCQYI